jgi:hypothetical protein
MKQFNFKLMAVLATVFMAGFASCDKDDNDTGEITDEFTIYLYGNDSWTPFEDERNVVFTVSPNDIIDITDDGTEVVFTGLAVGEATITATASSGVKKAKVYVRAMEAGMSFSIAAASIHYDHHNGETSTLTFDNYGKRCRLDTWGDDHSAFIFDGIGRHYYVCGSDGWVELAFNDMYLAGVVGAYLYDANAKALLMAPGISQMPNQTIAGKSCTVIGGTTPNGETIIYAGWSNMLFKVSNDTDTFEAVSFTTTVPANAFTQTVDIF